MFNEQAHSHPDVYYFEGEREFFSLGVVQGQVFHDSRRGRSGLTGRWLMEVQQEFESKGYTVLAV